MIFFPGIEQLKPWLDNLATRVPGATIIVVGTKLDQIPEGILVREQFESHMREQVVKLFRSETRFSKIKLAGVQFVSSSPSFKSYKESKALFEVLTLLTCKLLFSLKTDLKQPFRNLTLFFQK